MGPAAGAGSSPQGGRYGGRETRSATQAWTAAVDAVWMVGQGAPSSASSCARGVAERAASGRPKRTRCTVGDDKGGRLPKSKAIPVTPLDPEMGVHRQSHRRGHFQSRFAALVVDEAGASASDRGPQCGARC